MRKKICIALMAAFTVLLGVSSYFIIDHYREAEHQEQMYDSLVQLVEDSETEPAEPIIYSEDKTILPELTELYRQNDDGRLDLRGGHEHQLSRYADGG